MPRCAEWSGTEDSLDFGGSLVVLRDPKWIEILKKRMTRDDSSFLERVRDFPVPEDVNSIYLDEKNQDLNQPV